MRLKFIPCLCTALLSMIPFAASAHGHHGAGLLFGIAALGTALVATTAAIATAPFYAISQPAYYPPPQAYYAAPPAPAYYPPQQAAYNPPAYAQPAYYQQAPVYYATPAYYQQAPVSYAPRYYSYR